MGSGRIGWDRVGSGEGSLACTLVMEDRGRRDLRVFEAIHQPKLPVAIAIDSG